MQRAIVVILAVLVVALAIQLSAAAQQPQLHSSFTSNLPDAPGPQNTAPPASGAAQATATISGTIVDTNGDVIQGARIALRRRSGSNAEIIQSGGDGQFVFNSLPPGPYKLTVTAPGMAPYASSEFELNPGEVRILPQIALAVQAAATSVTVSANTDQLSVEQEQIAVQQRILGVIPNFYMSFDWNAPPMKAKQKFQLSLRSTFDPTAFVVIGAIAGAEQYKNVYPAFGSGWEGYGKRYGATFANHISDQFFSRAIYPSIFHQDPRYFYKGKGSVSSRAAYAVSAAFIARGDDGRWHPNYSSMLGKLTSSALSNLYYPASERGAGLVFSNTFIELGGDAAENLIKEFILKRLTSHVPKGADGEP